MARLRDGLSNPCFPLKFDGRAGRFGYPPELVGVKIPEDQGLTLKGVSPFFLRAKHPAPRGKPASIPSRWNSNNLA